MAKTTAKFLGVVLLFISLLGFFSPTFLALHLSLAHNLLNTILGLMFLYFGFVAYLAAARSFCLILGFLSGAVGLFGFLAGIETISPVRGASESYLLTVIPGALLFGTADHILHILLGLFSAAGGLLTYSPTVRYKYLEPKLLTDPAQKAEPERQPHSEPAPVLVTQPSEKPGKISEAIKYDVFISYRRHDGSESARLIRAELRHFNLKVFLDVEDLHAGYFDKAILKNIESTPNFIVVLSPNCLERCADENDWFRQEIAQAIRTERNIIPLLMPGFEFPGKDALPADIRELRQYQSVTYSHEFFDAMVEKIKRYLRR